MADGKVPVCTAGGAPVTKQYVYSLYDAKTGALRAKGTPQELMEQGYYNRAESVCTGYAHQKKKKAKPKKWRLEREEKQPKPKAEPDRRTDTQMREVWFYSMFDADGNLLHEGSAAELVEKGLFKNTQTVTNVFYAGHCRPQGSTLLFDCQLTDLGKNSEIDTRQQEPAAVAEKVMTDGMSMVELTQMLERHGYLIYEDMDETQIEKRFYREYNERNPEYAIHPMPHTVMVLAVRH